MSDLVERARGRCRSAAILVTALAALCAGGATQAQPPDLIGKTVVATSALADSPFAGLIADYVYVESPSAAVHAGVFETSRRAARGGRYRVKRPDAEPREWPLSDA